MRRLEQSIYQKVIHDFPTEVQILERAIDTLVASAKLWSERSPLLSKPDYRTNLLNVKPQERCETVHVLLMNHAVIFIQSSRLLLLTGYLVPSLSCQRTAFESFQSAHICLRDDSQSIQFLNGEYPDLRKFSKYTTPNDNKLSREIKTILSNFGVHVNYKALETQGLYHGSVLIPENEKTYKFLFLRNLHSFFSITSILISYVTNLKPFLKSEITDIPQILKDINNHIVSISYKLEVMSKGSI